MRRVTLRNLWAHKRRLLSTVVSVLLGVAFLSGTFVLTDTLQRSFDDLFRGANDEVDAEVRGPALFESERGGVRRGRFDESVAALVARGEEVAASSPVVRAMDGTVVDREGDRIGGLGPPTVMTNWVEVDDLNAFHLAEGRAPRGAAEVVLDRAAVDAGDYELGDQVGVLAPDRRTYRLVGISSFGEADSAAGAVTAHFSLAEAQRIARAPGQLDAVIARSDTLEPEALVTSLQEVLPDGLGVVTGEQAADEVADAASRGFGFFRQILTVFATVAVLVATFVIYNTFSILVAQRSREVALLRAVGAGRAQVLGSVLGEAVVIGLLASGIGLAAGVALAAGITALLGGLGVDLPSTSLVVAPFTVLAAFLVGGLVTTLAAVAPAVRATRVAPLAALRDVAQDRSDRSVSRVAAGIAIALGAAVLMRPAFAKDPSTDDLTSVGIGAGLLLLALIVLGPAIAGPIVGVLGAPVARWRGTTGRLARQNALRSPKRTAATASALMIGVGLVGFITVFAGSARASIEAQVAQGFTGDFVVQPAGRFGSGGAPAGLDDLLADVDGVDVVSAVRAGEAQVTTPDGHSEVTFLASIDPTTYPRVLSVSMEQGSLRDLRPGGAVVDRHIASERGLRIGDPVKVTLAGGRSATVTVQALSDDVALLGEWTIEQSTFDALASESSDALIAIGARPGADLEALRTRLERVTDAYPTVDLLDRDQWVGTLADQIDTLLNVIYGLLALSVVIAGIGIANTLSLSIHERTRELGLLRAVGMDRAQVRASVRWEAVLVALVGTALGLAVSVFVAWVVVRGLRGYGLDSFDVPVGSLAVVVGLGAALGVVASFRPARRAARMDVLAAIASE